MIMQLLKSKIFVFAFLLITLSVSATDYFTSSLSTRTGLSQNDVHVVFQDSRKFIWICTNDGLNRYDGYDFKIYNKGYNGLTSSLIESITEDKNNNLWVGTADKGLFCYNRLSDTFVPISKLSNSPSTKFPVSSPRLFIDNQENTIWIYSTNSEFYKIKFDNSFQKVIEISQLKTGIKGLNTTTIFQIIKDTDNRLWFATVRGISTYNYKTNSFKSVPNIQSPVFAISQIEKNKFVLNTNRKISIFDTKDFSLKAYFDVMDNSTLLFKNNTLWFVKANGFYKADYRSNEKYFNTETKIDDFNNWVCNSIIMDTNGVVWAGFYVAGVRQYKIDKKPFIQFGNQYPIGNNFVSTLIQGRSGEIWIGTIGAGAFRYEKTPTKPLEKELSKVNYLNQYKIYCIAQSTISDNLFIGSEGGDNLFELNPKTNNIQRLTISQRGVRALLADSNYLWIGTYNDGLYRYNLITKEILHLTKSAKFISNIVRNIVKDKKGNLWVGTADGLCVIPSSVKYLKHISCKTIRYQQDGIKKTISEYVIAICELTNGNFWIGTLGDGVKVIQTLKPDFSCDVKEYNLENGLSNNTIKSIIEDENQDIWISTNKGLNKINTKTENIQHYDPTDGLQDFEFNELSGLKCRNGAILFGGVNGLNMFYPNKIQIDSTPPALVLTDFLLAGQSVKVNEKYNNRIILKSDISEVKKIELSYNQNNFSFVFAGIHYLAPHKNRYRYKLLGFENNWNKDASNNRIAKYTNIPPGNYQFILEGCNNNDVWTKVPLEVEVIVHPPLWATWYAYLFYILIAIVAFLRYKNYLKNQQKQENEIQLAKLEKKRTKELMDMKVQFFTNISHEFRTPLTLILSPLQSFLSNKSIPEEIRKDNAIQTIEHNANILLKLINHLLNISKHDQQKIDVQLKNKNFSSFIRDVIQQFDFIAQSNNIAIKLISNSNEVNIWFDPFLMEQIIYNLISNALKYTAQGGQITLTLDETSDNVKLAIADNGYGISKDAQKHIFERFFSVNKSENINTVNTGIGLALTKSLIEMHKGTITFTSDEGVGTTFYIVFPKNDQSTTTFEVEESEEIPEEIIENTPVSISEEEDADAELDTNITLLVVDDNIQIIKLLTGLFSPYYNVISAMNGQEALELIQTKLPNIVISDVMMPIMDGLQLCKAVKSDEKISHTPVILLTAKATTENQTEGYSFYADGYCPKPFDNKMLISITKSVLFNKQNLAKQFRRSLDITPSTVTATASDEKFLNRLIQIIEERIDDPTLAVEDLYSKIGMSAINLNKKLKALTNMTAKIFIRNIRLKRAAQLLKMNRYRVSDVTFEVGFTDLKHFRECFKNEFGVLPVEYKNSGIDGISSDAAADLDSE